MNIEIYLILFTILEFKYKFKWRQEIWVKNRSQEIFTYKDKAVHLMNLCDQPIPVSIQGEYKLPLNDI